MCLGNCTIISKAKINVFWKIFFTPLDPSGLLRSKKFQKMLILAFEANSALSHENETKIVKITHSAARASSAGGATTNEALLKVIDG